MKDLEFLISLSFKIVTCMGAKGSGSCQNCFLDQAYFLRCSLFTHLSISNEIPLKNWFIVYEVCARVPKSFITKIVGFPGKNLSRYTKDHLNETFPMSRLIFFKEKPTPLKWPFAYQLPMTSWSISNIWL